MLEFEYTNPEKEHQKLLERIKTLTEEDKSVWSWEGKPLYKIGHGHEFLNGFFVEYTTLDAIKVTQFVDGRWFCGGETYKYNKESDVFEHIKIEPVERKDIDWSELKFPEIKVAKPTTFAMDIQPVKPMQTPPKKKDESTS